ncbi:MAG: DegT/DnrJ/EryC1/StrS family aminotransferase, partial [Flavobacterium sp.]|nr:DegT/DnrJ/EryC1/StrS family aminotransferase [Flavobacterium sp.]
IYDGAHAFGVKVNGKSVFEYGDISTCSLHATKLYHSSEGGLVITKDPQLLRKLAFIRNFGFNGPEAFAELGINGKNSEFHAAMGLVNLNHVDSIHDKRKELTERYNKGLKNLQAARPLWHKNATMNFAYYPLVFKDEAFMLLCMEKLKAQEIFTRRYFYPSLASTLPYLNSVNMPVTDDVAKRILCLPLYFDLSTEEQNIIIRILLRAQNYGK